MAAILRIRLAAPAASHFFYPTLAVFQPFFDRLLYISCGSIIPRMNEWIVGIVGSLIATAIWSFFFPSRGGGERPSRWRWFWRLMYLIGKAAFFFGLIVLALNLSFDPNNTQNIIVGASCFIYGGIAWLLGYLFR